MSNYQFLSIGDTTLDNFLKLDGSEAHLSCNLEKSNCELCLNYADKIPVSQYHTTLGGNSANAAVSAVRMGLSTAIWTVVGDDYIGQKTKKEFEKENISTEYLQVDEKVRSKISTVINYQSERTILIYGDHYDYKIPQLGKADWVYISSLGKTGDGVYRDISAWAREYRAKLVFQPGTFQIRMGWKPMEELLKITEIIVMNKEEAADYVGESQKTKIKNQNYSVALPQINIKELLKKLLHLGPRIAVITDGKTGAYVSDGKTVWSQGIDESVPVVERTGAGDAYSSAFTVAISKGKAIPEAMLWGALNSESVIQKIGPQAGILTLDELNKSRAQGRPRVEIASSPMLNPLHSGGR